MIPFLLWLIVLIIFWPIGLAVAVGALIYGLTIAGFWLIVFSIKAITAAVVLGQMVLAAWVNRRNQLSA
jgi:hypothetical protein